MNDEELHRLLRKHPAKTSLPPAFNREVWARIEAEEALSLASRAGELAARLFAMLSRPLASVTTVAIFAVIGAVAGAMLQRSSDDDVASHQAYVQAVHPLMRASLGGGR